MQLLVLTGILKVLLLQCAFLFWPIVQLTHCAEPSSAQAAEDDKARRIALCRTFFFSFFFRLPLRGILSYCMYLGDKIRALFS